jgi:hypothetical protein
VVTRENVNPEKLKEYAREVATYFGLPATAPYATHLLPPRLLNDMHIPWCGFHMHIHWCGFL